MVGVRVPGLPARVRVPPTPLRYRLGTRRRQVDTRTMRGFAPPKPALFHPLVPGTEMPHSPWRGYANLPPLDPTRRPPYPLPGIGLLPLLPNQLPKHFALCFHRPQNRVAHGGDARQGSQATDGIWVACFSLPPSSPLFSILGLPPLSSPRPPPGHQAPGPDHTRSPARPMPTIGHGWAPHPPCHAPAAVAAG